jgi:hypothetical protein
MSSSSTTFILEPNYLLFSPNGLRFSRVARLLPVSILPLTKKRSFNHFAPRLATSAASAGWAVLFWHIIT